MIVARIRPFGAWHRATGLAMLSVSARRLTRGDAQRWMLFSTRFSTSFSFHVYEVRAFGWCVVVNAGCFLP